MPVQSKIVPLEDDETYPSSDYGENWSPSPPPARANRSSFEDESHTYSGAVSHRDQRSYNTGNIQKNRAHAFSKPPRNSRHDSPISISSDNPGADVSKLRLEAQNYKLKLEVERLRGRVEALSDSYNTLLRDISGKIDTTERNVQKMVTHISTKIVGGIPGVQLAEIPLNPNEKDYENIGFWKEETWQSIRNGSHANDTDSSTYSLWMELPTGKHVPDGERGDVRTDAYEFWDNLFNDPKKKNPMAYRQNSFETKEAFRKLMEGRYPWLRLCEGHWKAKRVWKNCFAGWKKTRMPDEVTPVPAAGHTSMDQDDLKDKIFIEISDDDNSVGSKRGHRDDLDARPSKKLKGKAKEVVPTPNFHPARPVPKKKLKAKVAKAPVDPFANVHVTTSLSNSQAARSVPVASGSGTAHSSPPPQITVHAGLSDTQDAPVASDDEAVHSSPPPHITAIDPQLLEGAVGVAFTTTYTKITSVPSVSSGSPTPSFAPAPTNIRAPEIIPATPDFDSISLTEDSPTGSTTASSNSPDPVRPPKKKGKPGPLPYKQYSREVWVNAGNDPAKFEGHWKKLGEAGRVDAIKKIKQAIAEGTYHPAV